MSVLRPLDSEKPLPAKIDLAVMFACAHKDKESENDCQGHNKAVKYFQRLSLKYWWNKTMTQDERWIKQYDDVMDFLAKNHRNPSRHRLEEHDMLNWVKQQRKLKNKGELKAERAELLERLLSLCGEYRRVNQYV